MENVLGEFRYVDKVGNIVVDDGSGLRAFAPKGVFNVKPGEVVAMSIDNNNKIDSYEVVE